MYCQKPGENATFIENARNGERQRRESLPAIETA